eukprot:scaffold26893_cov18-Tisochrysis_lutea.AAC.1
MEDTYTSQKSSKGKALCVCMVSSVASLWKETWKWGRSSSSSVQQHHHHHALKRHSRFCAAEKKAPPSTIRQQQAKGWCHPPPGTWNDRQQQPAEGYGLLGPIRNPIAYPSPSFGYLTMLATMESAYRAKQ